MFDVVLYNFGGPTREEEVRPFLNQIFNDPNIINLPRLLRKIVSSLIVARRVKTSESEYRQIGYSPSNRIAKEQAKLLQRLLNEDEEDRFRVHLINRYCQPFAAEVISNLDLKARSTVWLGLFPHYSKSTIGSYLLDFQNAMNKKQVEPKEMIVVKSWWNDESYLEYFFKHLRLQVGQVLEQSGELGLTMLFSAHGIPKRQADQGDPYVNEIKVQFKIVKERLEAWLKEFEGGKFAKDVLIKLSFQSRSTPVEWVKPYTDQMIRDQAKCGGALFLVPVSFVSDQIETQYEMDVTYKNMALSSGFDTYHRMKMPNNDPDFVECLKSIVQNRIREYERMQSMRAQDLT